MCLTIREAHLAPTATAGAANAGNRKGNTMRKIQIRPNHSLYTIMTELQMTAHFKHGETLRLTKSDMHQIRDGKKAARQNDELGFTITLSTGDEWLIQLKKRGTIRNYRRQPSVYAPITI